MYVGCMSLIDRNLTRCWRGNLYWSLLSSRLSEYPSRSLFELSLQINPTRTVSVQASKIVGGTAVLTGQIQIAPTIPSLSDKKIADPGVLPAWAKGCGDGQHPILLQVGLCPAVTCALTLTYRIS